MARRSRFQAPRVVSDFETVQRALREVQEALDSATTSRARLTLYTADFPLVAGSFHRASANGTIQARLPAASGENLADPIYLSLEGMNGTVEVWAAPGQTVNGGPTASFTVDGIIALWSNGVNAWSGIAQVPAESPAGEALDAQYILGAAHASLPNGSVGTSTSLIAFAATPGTTATWTFDTAAFLALIDSTSLVVSGSTLVRAALTGAIASAQNANTTLFSGIRANGVATTDRTNINFPNQTYITWSGVDDAGNDEIELRANFLGSFYAEDGVGAFQTPFISFDNSTHLNSAIVNNIGTSGYINVSWDQNLAAGYAWTGVHSFTATGFTVLSSSTTRIEGLATIVEANGAGSDLALISGRDVDVDADRDFVVDAQEAVLITSHGTTVDRINLLAAAGRIDLTALSIQVDSSGSVGGFLQCKEATASTPAVTAGYGMFWVLNDAPSVPMYTGDTNVDLRILTEGNVDQSVGHIDLDTSHNLIYRKSRQREFWHEECTFNASLAALTTVTTSGLHAALQCTNWWMVATGASGQWGPVASINNHMGILRMTTGATSGNTVQLYNGVAQTLGYDTYRGDEIYMAEAIIRIPTATSVIFEFGFRNNAGDAYIEWYGDTNVNANVRTYVEEASVSTDTDTGVAIGANTWSVYTILQETLGTVDFYLDDVLEDTRTTNIPDAETMALYFLIGARSNATRTIDIDYVSFESQGMGARTT